MKVTFDEESLVTRNTQRPFPSKESPSIYNFVIAHSGGLIKSRASATLVMILFIVLSAGASIALLSNAFGEDEVRPVPSQAVPIKSAR